MFNIPKTLNISGIKVDVSIEKEKLLNENSFGSYDGRQGKITIAGELSDSQKKSTLIHEVIEGINHIYNLELEHHKICILEIALNQFFESNNVNWIKK